MTVGVEPGLQEARPPYIAFKRIAVKDNVASREKGIYIPKDEDYVHITPAGTKDELIHKVSKWLVKIDLDVKRKTLPVTWRDHFKRAYQAWLSGQELPTNGYPIKAWPMISPAQQEILIHRNVRTVEDLAELNAEGLQSVGMGAVDMKNKAQAWLKQAKDKGPLTQEVTQLQSENALLKTNMDGMAQTMEHMKAQMAVLERGQAVQVAPVTAAPEPLPPHALPLADIMPEDDGLVGAGVSAKGGKKGK